MPLPPLSLATLPIRLAFRLLRTVLGAFAPSPVAEPSAAERERAEAERAPVAPERAEAEWERAEAERTPAGRERAEADAPPSPPSREPGSAPDADPPSAFAEPPPSEAGVEAEAEPDHVSAEPVLVAESADPEAADGVRIDLHVAEPWDGYSRQRAADVIAALESASAAELAVVQLYESTHRRRKTVLAAAERRMRTA